MSRKPDWTVIALVLMVAPWIILTLICVVLFTMCVTNYGST